MVYQWSGFSYKVPAQKVGEELERLEAENGKITKEMVVDAARPEDSVMHNIFEWNDSKAAEMWRGQQAKMMLSSLHIIVKTQDEKPQQISIRAYSNVKDDDSRIKAEYINTPSAINNERDVLLKNAMRELEEFTRKYRMLTEFADIIAAIDKWKDEKLADAV